MKRRLQVLFVIFVALAAPFFVPAQSDISTFLPQSAEAILEGAERAILEENYRVAVERLQEGRRSHPDRIEFPFRLGRLYADRDLHDLALDEFRAAERIEADNPELIDAVAVTLGRLNRDDEAIAYFERLASIAPSADVAGDLGWMYFKARRLDEAEGLLLAAIDRFGKDPALDMTLGTVYAAMYRYDDSRTYYERSIESALDQRWDQFASVAYYNLSLLEQSFYNFNNALERTTRSIEYQSRATGYLSRGGLYEGAMDFAQAERDYLQADALDDETPLPAMNLAELYGRFGSIQNGLAYMERVIADDDASWIYGFGTDTVRHRMRVHDILSDLHRGRAWELRLTPVPGPLRWIANRFEAFLHNVQGWYHASRFSRLAEQVARLNYEQGQHIEAYWTYYLAHEAYPAAAGRYLRRAEALETAVAPRSATLYMLEKAVLEDDAPEIERAVAAVDQFWQLDAVEIGLRELSRLYRSREPERSRGIRTRLFRLNRGALRQYGLKLPVDIRVQLGEGLPRRVGRVLHRQLSAAGFEHVSRAPLRLDVFAAPDGELRYIMLDDGEHIASFELGVATIDAPAMAQFATTIAEQVLSERPVSSGRLAER